MSKVVNEESLGKMAELQKEYIDGKVFDANNALFDETTEIEAGDVVFWRQEEDNIVFSIAKTYEDISYHYYNSWNPYGIVVIPPSHNVYGTGEAGIMAVDCYPLTNTFGNYSYDDIKRFDSVNIFENQLLSSNTLGNLPSDSFYGIECPTDNHAAYSENVDSNYIPSPYNEKRRNLLYYTTKEIPTIEPTYKNYKTDEGFNIRWEVIEGDWGQFEQENAFDNKEFICISPGDDNFTKIRCYFSGVKGTIAFSCKSEGELGYDYLTIGEIDEECSRDNYKYSMDYEENLICFEFETLDEEEHFVEFCYSKDSSYSEDPDNATVFVVKDFNLLLTEGVSGSGSDSNVLSDFNGKENTLLMIDKLASDWMYSISDVNEIEFPIAGNCLVYTPNNWDMLDFGDWYLPSAGELGYLVARSNKILENYSQMSGFFDLSYIPEIFYSSSLDSNNNPWAISRSDGFVSPNSITYAEFVPFTRKKLVPTDKLTRRINGLEGQFLDLNKSIYYLLADVNIIKRDVTDVTDRVDTVESTTQIIPELTKALFKEDKAGDAVLVNKLTGEKIAVSPEELGNYSKDDYEPIGVIVIPSSHNVYKTNECGVVSLVLASLTTPDLGSTGASSIYFGQNNTYISGLINWPYVVNQGNMSLDIFDTIKGTSSYGRIPMMSSSMAKKIECPTDPGTWYYNSTSSSYGYIPSPYLKDGSRNEFYYAVKYPSSSLNAMSDFNGKSNTEILINSATALSDWKTAESIINERGAGYSPAACACWRYHTLGTEQGDWYLPACGELGYVGPRYDKINETLSEISRVFGISTRSIPGSILTSSRYNQSNVRYILFSSGTVDYSGNLNYVRPFYRIKLNTRDRITELEKKSQHIIDFTVKEVPNITSLNIHIYFPDKVEDNLIYHNLETNEHLKIENGVVTETNMNLLIVDGTINDYSSFAELVTNYELLTSKDSKYTVIKANISENLSLGDITEHISNITICTAAGYLGCDFTKIPNLNLKYYKGTDFWKNGKFMNNTILETVICPDIAPTFYCESMFAGCTNLREVHNMPNMKVLMKYMFLDCTSLEYINEFEIRSNCYYAFRNCVSLKELPCYYFYDCFDSRRIYESVGSETEEGAIARKPVVFEKFTNAEGLFQRAKIKDKLEFEMRDCTYALWDLCNGLLVKELVATLGSKDDYIVLGGLWAYNVERLTVYNFNKINEAKDQKIGDNFMPDSPDLRYIHIEGINSNLGFSKAPWGEGSEENRQSVIDSLINYSFDLASEGKTAIITLSEITYDLLTPEERNTIRDKGYTLKRKGTTTSYE